MKAVKLIVVFWTLAGVLASDASAATHTWRPAARALAYDPGATQTVVIEGVKINWGAGEFDRPVFDEIYVDPSYGWSGILHQYTREATTEAMRRVCNNRQLSADHRNTSGLSGVQERWIVALAVFNAMRAKNLLFTPWDTVNNSIELIVDNKSYKGFKIWYSDYSSETWMVHPGWKTSSVSLYDSPVPGSLNLGARPDARCPN